MSIEKRTEKGTIYLHGTPSHFDPAIDKALNLGPDDTLLDLDMYVDGIRSIVERTPIYRVDYTVAKAVKNVVSVNTRGQFNLLTWLSSWFRSPDSIS